MPGRPRRHAAVDGGRSGWGGGGARRPLGRRRRNSRARWRTPTRGCGTAPRGAFSNWASTASPWPRSSWEVPRTTPGFNVQTLAFLVRSGGLEAGPFVCEGVRHPNEEVRMSAANLLFLQLSPEAYKPAVDVLAGGLRDRNYLVSAAAPGPCGDSGRRGLRIPRPCSNC